MSHSKETANYQLPIYADEDMPTYLGEWNETMTKLDDDMFGLHGEYTKLNQVIVNHLDNDAKEKAEINSRLDGHDTDIANLKAEDEKLSAADEELSKRITDNANNISGAVETANNAIEKANSAEQSAETALNTANEAKTTASENAPKDHASETTEYGIGTTSKYGHVKISNSKDISGDGSDGIVMSPTAIKQTINEYISIYDASGIDNAIKWNNIVRTAKPEPLQNISGLELLDYEATFTWNKKMKLINLTIYFEIRTTGEGTFKLPAGTYVGHLPEEADFTAAGLDYVNLNPSQQVSFNNAHILQNDALANNGVYSSFIEPMNLYIDTNGNIFNKHDHNIFSNEVGLTYRSIPLSGLQSTNNWGTNWD